MSGRPNILVINLGWEQEPLLDVLQARGHTIFGVHYDESYYRDVDLEDILICDMRDLGAITAFAKKIGARAVISDQCDYAYFVQACIAEELGLPGPRIAQAQVATNKFLQREKAKECGINVPEYRLCVDYGQAQKAAAAIGYPVIVKPVDNRGSFGVLRVDDESELRDAFYSALVHSHSRLTLVERFIEGLHFTVDGYAFRDIGPRSLALGTKKLIGAQKQVAVDIQYPGELAECLYEKALRYNEFVNTALGFDFGMLHSEYMATDSGDLYLIETANRGGGVYTSEIIVPAVSGVDVVNQYVCDVLGESKMYLNGTIERNTTLLKFYSFEPGVISALNGRERLDNDPEVLRYRFAVQAGDTIQAITNDANRHGFFILRSDGDIRAKAEDLVQAVQPAYQT